MESLYVSNSFTHQVTYSGATDDRISCQVRLKLILSKFKISEDRISRIRGLVLYLLEDTRSYSIARFPVWLIKMQ